MVGLAPVLTFQHPRLLNFPLACDNLGVQDLISFGAKSHLGSFAKIIMFVSNANSSFILSIAKDCLIGAQSVIMLGATLEDESWLGALFVAPSNFMLQFDNVYVGVDFLVQIY